MKNVFIYGKDPYEAKDQFLVNKRKRIGLKHLNDSKALLNTRMIWMIFIKMLKNPTQTRNTKY